MSRRRRLSGWYGVPMSGSRQSAAARLIGILDALSVHPDKDVRLAVANNPHASAWTLGVLARDSDSVVRCAVAHNRNAAERTIVALMGDRGVHESLAGSPNVTASQLISLLLTALDEDDLDLAAEVLRNPTLDWETVDAVWVGDPIHDPDSGDTFTVDGNYKYFAASNPNMSEFLRQANTSTAVAMENPAVTAEELVEEFETGEAKAFRAAALSGGTYASSSVIDICHHPNTPPDLLDELARSGDAELLDYVAYHPALSAATLRRLAAHPERSVRTAVAYHPKTPGDVLAGLAASTPPLLGAANNPRFLVDRRSKPSSHWSPRVWCGPDMWPGSVGATALTNPSFPSDLLGILASTSDAFSRRFIARNPALPPVAAETLAATGDNAVLEHLARNPACDGELLRRLAENESEAVQAALANNPNVPEDVLRGMDKGNSAVAAGLATNHLDLSYGRHVPSSPSRATPAMVL